MAHSTPETNQARGTLRQSAAGPVRRAAEFGLTLLGAGRDGACVIELVVARPREVLSTVYGTLRRLGLRLVHTEVKVSDGQIVQRLHLLEPDDTPPKPHRIQRALGALYATFSGEAAFGGGGALSPNYGLA